VITIVRSSHSFARRRQSSSQGEPGAYRASACAVRPGCGGASARSSSSSSSGSSIAQGPRFRPCPALADPPPPGQWCGWGESKSHSITATRMVKMPSIGISRRNSCRGEALLSHGVTKRHAPPRTSGGFVRPEACLAQRTERRAIDADRLLFRPRSAQTCSRERWFTSEHARTGAFCATPAKPRQPTTLTPWTTPLLNVSERRPSSLPAVTASARATLDSNSIVHAIGPRWPRRRCSMNSCASCWRSTALAGVPWAPGDRATLRKAHRLGRGRARSRLQQDGAPSGVPGGPSRLRTRRHGGLARCSSGLRGAPARILTSASSLQRGQSTSPPVSVSSTWARSRSLPITSGDGT
jgi:hypothetical protein